MASSQPGIKQLSPAVHWQADSYPLYHQLSPCTFFNKDEATSRQHNHPSPQFTLPFTLWVREKYNDVQAFQVAPVVKNLPANAGDIRDVSSIPGSGRSPGRKHGNPLQYSCLENPMDRGAWLAIVHGVAMDTTKVT